MKTNTMHDNKIQWSGCDNWLILLVTAAALLVRLPHWQTIPAAGDEVGQVIYSLQIVNGQAYPLVGNDAYAGPFFFYLLASLIRLGVTLPLLGRVIVMATGTLTATLTYAWVRRLGGNRLASVVAAGLIAANPHLVLVNSHAGGTTFLMPFFTTLFLLLLTSAVKADRAIWLLAAAVASGLALQANPVAGLLILSGWVWATLSVRGAPRLGRRWPLWPIVGGLGILLVYSPVIYYNLTTDLNTIAVLEERTYLWEAHPTLFTFLNNERRLALQLLRQVSGVLLGDETIRAVVGIPLLYLAWVVAGLAFTTRRVSRLPLVIILPFFIIFPIFSSHYGMIEPVRFTSILTPVLAAGMGLAAAAVPTLASRRFAAAALVAAALLIAYPLISLFRYYDYAQVNYLAGRPLLELSQEIAARNNGAPVYISRTESTMRPAGIPYVPQTYLIFANAHQEFLPPEEIVGRLFEFPDAGILILSHEDAAFIQQVAVLTPWPAAANEEANMQGYGVYTLNTEAPLVKPDFVLTGGQADVSPRVPVGETLAGALELVGYDAPERVSAGEMVELTLYWRAVGSLPYGRYMGFAHLFNAGSMDLVGQNDHILGQSQYPVNAWRSDEIVIDRYALQLPPDVTPGEHVLRIGVYSWPDLQRLDVPGSPEDVVELKPLRIDP
ncbi:MAG: glycosyltransferase family 39 protein [Anaerolineae bacterium]